MNAAMLVLRIVILLGVAALCVWVPGFTRFMVILWGVLAALLGLMAVVRGRIAVPSSLRASLPIAEGSQARFTGLILMLIGLGGLALGVWVI